MFRFLRFTLSSAVVPSILSVLPAVCAAQVNINGSASLTAFDPVTFQPTMLTNTIQPPLSAPYTITGSAHIDAQTSAGLLRSDLTMGAALGRLTGFADIAKPAILGSVGANGMATFADKITITSATLPNGAAARVRVKATLSGSTQKDTNDPRAGTVASANGSVTFGGSQRVVFLGAAPNADILSVDFFVDGQVGQTYAIGETLNIGTATQFSFAQVNLALDYRLFSQTSGVTLLSQSGAIYSTPEPGAVPAALIGLACGLLWRGRCRARRKSA